MKIDLKVGDKVELLEGGDWGTSGYPPPGTIVNVIAADASGCATGDQGAGCLTIDEGQTYNDFPIRKVEDGVFIDTEEMDEPTDLDGSPINPAHYQFPGGIQVIDLTRHLGFLEGNIVKYVARAGRKGAAKEDLLKARQYLDWLIEDTDA